jgi:hypothetical protein
MNVLKDWRQAEWKLFRVVFVCVSSNGAMYVK